MRRVTVAVSMLLMLVAAFAADAQVRGRGRLQGNIVDKATGKPIAGATVTISTPDNSTEPIVAHSDGRGHWAAIGMTGGMWNVDIVAKGYATSRGTVNLSELQQTPPIKTELTPEVVQEAPAAAAPSSPRVPPEAIAAIKEGQELLKLKAGDPSAPDATGATHPLTADEVKANAQKAVDDFTKALPQIPEDSADLKTVKNQVMEVLAQAYYKAGDLNNAISTLEKLNVSDPWTTPDPNQVNREVLLANLYLENGQLAEGKNLLDKLPPTAITDPTAYVNIGILFLNKKDPASAEAYFTKAIGIDAKSAANYYYRGLAEIQQKKNKEAKADFQQVLTLSPDSPEAHDAKQLLASLK